MEERLKVYNARLSNLIQDCQDLIDEAIEHKDWNFANTYSIRMKALESARTLSDTVFKRMTDDEIADWIKEI